MLSFLLWYLILTILGLLTFPLAYRMLPALADRGYALSRTLGLLIWGYLFWLLGSLGILKNDIGGEILALVILIGLSWWALCQAARKETWLWIKSNRRLILTVEILFFVSFAVFAFIRSANPEIVGTEKPMELAFINAILRSPSMPPNDPWLSGYAISYYYFGYVLVAMIARLAGSSGGVAFNLGVSLVFSLAALGSYGVLYSLVNRQRSNAVPVALSAPRSLLCALLAPFFVFIVSNMGGLLHLLRFWNVFWQTNETGEKVSRLWAWLDMGRYATPPTAELFPHWWWWQASRIVQDFDFNWTNKGDVIDEFPFFTFLLGDLHPHVLAMPFAFLAIGLALNLFFGGGVGSMRWFGLRFKIKPSAFLLGALVMGSLAFFNTWDFPFYLTLFAGAYILRGMFLDRDNIVADDRLPTIWHVLGELLKLGFALGVSGVMLYLPFYFGFQSQAGGPLPNLIYITRGIYLWIQFAPFLLPILGFLIYLWVKNSDAAALKNGLKLTSGLVLLLLALTLFLAFLISILQVFQKINPEAAMAGNAYLGSMAAPGWWPLILEGFKRRFLTPGTLLTLFTILSLTFALLWPRRPQPAALPPPPSTLLPPPSPLHPSHIFTLLLILTGTLLVLAPEFVFLRDLFGYRINTIFKFYFQVWLMWGIAAAYAVIVLSQKLKNPGRSIFQFGIFFILVLSLTYPLMGVWSKTNGFQSLENFTLDGSDYLKRGNVDEKAAMDWLKTAPLGTLAEAVGGSYSQYARMASNSGQPTVLGWDFHEIQWRGGTTEMGSRKEDIERLYCTADWDQANQILKQYNIRYVVLGQMEMIAYGKGSQICPTGLMEGKFNRYLSPVFIQGGVTIYEVPGWSAYPAE